MALGVGATRMIVARKHDQLQLELTAPMSRSRAFNNLVTFNWYNVSDGPKGIFLA